MTYYITCETYREEGRKAQYWGESARTDYQRDQDHQAALRNEEQESPLVKHHLEWHQGTLLPSYSMRIHQQCGAKSRKKPRNSGMEAKVKEQSSV